MAVVGISCAYVDDVQRNIGNARKAINDVKTNLNNARRELSPHSGNSRISSDYSTINSKLSRLNSDITSLNNFEKSFNTFVNSVKEADSRCARSIRANSQVYNSANGIPNRPFMAALSGILNKSINIVKKLLSFAFNPFGALLSGLLTMKDSIKDFYNKNVKPWIDKGKEVFNKFKEWVKDGYKWIKVKFKEVIKSALKGIMLLPYKVGNAIKNAGTWLWDKIKGVGNWIWDNKWALLKLGLGAVAVGAAIFSGGIAAIPAVFLANDIISGAIDLFFKKDKDGEYDFFTSVFIDGIIQGGMDFFEETFNIDIPDKFEDGLVNNTKAVYTVANIFAGIGAFDQFGYSGKYLDDIFLGAGLKLESMGSSLKNWSDIDSLKSSWKFFKKDVFETPGILNKLDGLYYSGSSLLDDIANSAPMVILDINNLMSSIKEIKVVNSVFSPNLVSSINNITVKNSLISPIIFGSINNIRDLINSKEEDIKLSKPVAHT